jgi:hypothetical protein
VLGHAEAGPDAVQPQVVGRATLEVLVSLAAVTPLLVAIDDVQWLDPASTRTLAFAIRRLEAVPVGVLLTRRGTDDPLPLGLDDALPQGRRGRLLLGPLDPNDLELLVERRLGEPLPRALRRRLAAAADGNPLYALELVAAQRRSGNPRGDLLALPARLEELLADRLGRLPPEATGPLAAVAGLAAPTVALIAAVLESAPPGPVSADLRWRLGMLTLLDDRESTRPPPGHAIARGPQNLTIPLGQVVRSGQVTSRRMTKRVPTTEKARP